MQHASVGVACCKAVIQHTLTQTVVPMSPIQNADATKKFGKLSGIIKKLV